MPTNSSSNMSNLLSVPQSTFEVYCIFLYLFILYTLIRTKIVHLKKPFFKIFISTGFMDILSLISNMYMRLSQQFRLGPEQRKEYMWANYLSGVALTGHILGNILLQCNRFTSVVYPSKHLDYWSSRSLFLAIFLQYFIAITTKLFYFNYPIPYIWIDNQWTLGSLPTEIDIIAKLINITISTIYAVIGIVFNFFIIRRLSKITHGNNLSVNTHEKGLVFYSITLFIVAMLMSTQQIIRIDTNSKELNKKSRNATKKSKEPPALSSASPPPIETKSKSNVPKVLSAKGGRSNVSPEKTTMTEVSTIRANVVPPMCIFEKEITQEYDPVEDFAQNQANSKKIKWVGDDVARQFVENLPNEQTISQEYYFLESFEIKKSCDAFQNNMERNRSNKHIVLDENRVILDRPGSENLNYINASRINVPGFCQQIICGATSEIRKRKFCGGFLVHELTGPQVPTKLFKDGAQEYQYVGKMFIHTRKSETLHDLKINTIEVLPEGMSDAVSDLSSSSITIVETW
ncbi:unnamed protein product [Caenorhabditis angaria]|uniref:Tyrosine-protein phosphatase domain-containing protein n=1 Tax=Caenorhabditis angaria TaxID=860376 RepID=A0A9P1IRG0_9PELO|nr:unnamed protein product [Caenorhabditis angaria]